MRSGAGKPQRRKVSEICLSNWVRSVTTTMSALARRGSRRILVASHSMVSDFPDPWVCQTTPPRSSGLVSDRMRRIGRLDGPVLLAAGQLLDHPALLWLVDHEAAQDVQQRRWGQHPHDELRLALRLHPETLPHFILSVRSYRLPLEVGVLRRASGGIGRGGPQWATQSRL